MIGYRILVAVMLSVFSFNVFAAVTLENPPSNEAKKSFRFFINSDPQMGEKNTQNASLKKLNQLLDLFVGEVNKKNQEEAVDFVIYNGDLVYKVKKEAFDHFAEIVSRQKPPVKLVHGNHDGSIYDENFSQIQSKLSGYKKLNYSFDYGDWHFVVIGAQEKYSNDKQKEVQLKWLKTELKNNANKNVMLFMHYHIMPVGLSQMEFYSYWPESFKHQILDAITEHNNVKYVFSGHVHSGIKASIKSSLEYKGTKFVVCPTPVMARPFGEEMIEYEQDAKDTYFRRGFYLEVVVKGNDIELIGHKIQNEHSFKYPGNFNTFKREDDLRFFLTESKLFPKSEVSLDFDKSIPDWYRSYRYQKDHDSAFKNEFVGKQNHLNLTAPWGSWNFDEYMETYLPVKFDGEKDNTIHYSFVTPHYDKNGAGGYIRVFLYAENEKLNKQILLYWGAQMNKQKYTYQSLFYHAEGSRIDPNFINNRINRNKLYMKQITFDESIQEQHIKINVNEILKHLANEKNLPDSEFKQFSHMVIGHGVWVSLNRKGTPFKSDLVVKKVDLSHQKMSSGLLLNELELNIQEFDKSNPFYQY